MFLPSGSAFLPSLQSSELPFFKRPLLAGEGHEKPVQPVCPAGSSDIRKIRAGNSRSWSFPVSVQILRMYKDRIHAPDVTMLALPSSSGRLERVRSEASALSSIFNLRSVLKGVLPEPLRLPPTPRVV